MAHKDTVNIHLENRYATTWRKHNAGQSQIWIRGTVFFEGRFCSGDNALAPFGINAALLDDPNYNDLRILLNQFNGFFAVIIRNAQTVLASVDRIRSIPLFYGEAQGQVFLSDDAEWVRISVGDKEMEPIARQEFLHTGYVTGSATLFPHVKQLQAGEMLRITEGKDGPVLRTHRYYRFLHIEPDGPVDEEALLAELDAVSEKSVQRLIEYANGRQIVVPLSGGLDSRLIVTLLRRLGYENVLTFSYGVPGNHESLVSKGVAESLNYPWEFVKYSNALWRKWWNSKQRIEYQWWASGWTSLPVIQDWPAVWQLKENRKVSEKCIFVPGHTGDFISGGHIPITVHTEDEAFRDDLCQSIISKHYAFADWHQRDSEGIRKWDDRIVARTEAPLVGNGINMANWFEKWEWQERQAKFIINSVRVYEFWNYDWYLPLWDKDFMIFWQNVPLRLRKNKTLYDKFVNIAYIEQYNRMNIQPFLDRYKSPMNDEHQQVKRENFIKRALRRIPQKQKNIVKMMISPARIVYSYLNEPLARYGRYPIVDFIILYFKGFELNGISAQIYMKEICKRVAK